MPRKELTLCSVGVFGSSNFIRNVTIPETLGVQKNSMSVFNVPHVYIEGAIGATLNINLRQRASSELSFVSFKNEATYTAVHFNTIGVETGVYTLFFESYL